MRPWQNTVHKARALLQPQIDQGTATCGKCGHPVVQGMAWDVGHIIAQDIAPHMAHDPANWRIEHRRCNRSAGATYGNRKRRRRMLPTPSRTW
jgi:5-methylcytosine-specific restriction endonuclease McrA